MSEKLAAGVAEALELAFVSNGIHTEIKRNQDKIDDIGRIANMGGNHDQARELQDDIRGEKSVLEQRFEAIQEEVGSLIGREIEDSETLFSS